MLPISDTHVVSITKFYLEFYPRWSQMLRFSEKLGHLPRPSVSRYFWWLTFVHQPPKSTTFRYFHGETLTHISATYTIGKNFYIIKFRITHWIRNTIWNTKNLNRKKISFSEFSLPTGQGRSTLATLSTFKLIFHYSKLMVWSNKIFDVKTNWILSDRLHEILIKNLEREKMSSKVESVASVVLPWPV